jgi:hypothetical protein
MAIGELLFKIAINQSPIANLFFIGLHRATPLTWAAPPPAALDVT